jgi:hypothetical protein
MTSFIGYINNTLIKHTIYFNPHMRIDEQITNIKMPVLFFTYSILPEQIHKTTIYRSTLTFEI